MKQTKPWPEIPFNSRKKRAFHSGNLFIVVEQMNRKKNHPNRIILLSAKDIACKQFWETVSRILLNYDKIVSSIIH